MHKSDAEYIEKTQNIPRFFAENRQVGVVLLIGTLLWGLYGYARMPKRKDPNIPVRVAVATCRWPGVNAEQVEQLVTRQMEQAIAQSSKIHPPSASDYGIKSLTLPGLAIVYVQLSESVSDTRKEFNDINLRLQAINDQLPQGAGPIDFQSDFGDTAALMLTVASPPADEIEIAARAASVRRAIEAARASRRAAPSGSLLSIIYCFPNSVPQDLVQRPFQMFARAAIEQGLLSDVRPLTGPGFTGVDALSDASDAEILAFGMRFVRERLHESEIHPDAWLPVVIRDPQETQAKLAAVAGEKYSYRELDDFTDLIQRTLHEAPEVAKVDRSGVLPEWVYLNYSQERLAGYGLQLSDLQSVLQARNISLPGGQLEVGRKNLRISPSGEFKSPQAIGEVIVGTSSSSGSPVFLRDLVDIARGYQSPPRFLNFYQWRDADGKWHRSRAVTVAVQMRAGEQIGEFSKSVDARLASVRQLLPHDLIVARTSDQSVQTEENVKLFMDSLYEAIALVVLVSLIGFWEWRSSLLMALSIPTTLLMTFGFAYLLGIDIQQVSIASLIIALGLLVDDPVVAGDAIKRSIAAGHPRLVAAWLGPTKLTRAITYATITNIAAYLPFLLLTGNTGDFLYSLPIVLTCSLVSSRIVSMTFIPLLAYYILRPGKKPEPTLEESRHRGFTGFYYRVAGLAIEHRWKVFAGSLVFLAIGVLVGRSLKTSFFPDDVQALSYANVWLSNDAPLIITDETAQQVEGVIRETAARYGEKHPGSEGKSRQILHSITTFVGGGGPRFWFSVSPELQQLNYAQIIIEITNKDDMPELVREWQTAISAQVPGATVDIRQLQTNPVDMPLEVRFSGQADISPAQEARDLATLRSISERAQAIFRKIPEAVRVRDDWNEESFEVELKVNPDRANIVGISNADVARSSTAAMSGTQVTTLREGDKQVPVVARLLMQERAQLSDIQNLYVYSSQTSTKVPLLAISDIDKHMTTDRIRRLEHFRTVSVQCFPAPGFLPSDVLGKAMPELAAMQKSLPPGYKMQIGGEYAKQTEGFGNLAVVMAISIFMIFLALVMQFNHAVKPFLVFAATPYGVVGALLALWIMGTPFGFMAFLGIASLIGVIVSHVIVLFDFIEEMHEKGEPMEQAIRDAGIERLRPVLITVGATVLALFPLTAHGGPLWQPLTYAQIGGLCVATFITLLLVPVLYTIFVVDLKIVKWEGKIWVEDSTSPEAPDSAAGN